MLGTDLRTLSPMCRTTAVRRSLRPISLYIPGILLFSCALYFTTECYAQDVADAAKQERARKESQQKKSKHVYTEEDLKRAQILTPEDRAQIEARKNQAAPDAGEKSQDALDAKSLSPDVPLGDVARRFRRLKELQKLQQSAEFHLPLADAPVLASPKPMQPVRPHAFKPAAPAAPRFAPYRPPVKRSPFARPRIFTAAPPMIAPSHPPATRLAPAQPPAPVAPTIAPLNPAKRDVVPTVVTVKRGDSLWKLAQQHLGHGHRWHDLLSANPGILDASYIVAGSQIVLPTSISSARTTTKFTVRPGDTLSQIAQSQLGRASYAACIAHANPSIYDPNLIYAGQVLLLPASCTL
ncbi:MAG: LysM peptidoglycan-binding domain-containing protein [Candidatus Acidiferrum sp.]